MHIRNLLQKCDISFVIKDAWHLPVHKHTHYELHFIIKGRGQHVINDQSYPYNKGDVFILPPQIAHYFLFDEKTAICVVKFHEVFFEENLNDADFRRLIKGFSSPNRKMSSSGSQRQQAIMLMELVIAEYRKQSAYNMFIIKSALTLVIALMAKNTISNTVSPKEEKIQEILFFIDKHITEKELLTVSNISKQFNINKTYFNQYFSKATGSSYKRYVQTYALNLIAQKFTHQKMSLSQLAFQYGYTDESHLSNAFKAHFGLTPTAFKKANTF